MKGEQVHGMQTTLVCFGHVTTYLLFMKLLQLDEEFDQ